jgi:hypothetical protein
MFVRLTTKCYRVDYTLDIFPGEIHAKVYSRFSNGATKRDGCECGHSNVPNSEQLTSKNNKAL